jgi:Bacterial extracellular solute-binding proteins, family 5 Middle
MFRPARALLLVACATACARAPEPGAPEPRAAADTCLVAGTPGRVADTLDVVLDPPPDASLVPESGSDWFAFAHSFETLVRLDCTGAPEPGLAASWERRDGGRAWTFTLREGATLPDGLPLTPDSIVEGWRRAPASARLALADVTEVAPAGERGIRVSFAAPTDSAPALLADPGLALGLGRPGPWQTRQGTFIRLVAPPRDLRDALDSGVDLVVTADAPALAYARSRPELAVVPLPWGRTYVLVSTRPFPPAREDRVRGSLARDVVREEARPAEPMVWWDVGCAAAATPPSSARAPEARVAYPAGDPTAAALAGRLVALGAAGPRGTAHPMPALALLSQLERGQLVAAVLPLPRLDPMPCAARSLALAGWSVAPLVDTRAHLIARRDGPPLQADGLGAVRLAPRDAAGP